VNTEHRETKGYNPAMPRIYLERREMGEELQRLFDLLDQQSPGAPPAGDCHPPVDVVESAAGVEVVMDVPGISREHIHIVYAQGTLLIAGMKRASACSHHGAAFHLAERAFGRFARAVRIGGAVDAGRARATLKAGELRVLVPRIKERRGAEIRIAIETE
jgi:HSP20 family protein